MHYSIPWFIWNIFLAALPVLFAGLLTVVVESFRKHGKTCPWFVWIPIGVCWLAFLPNSCYLLTEWRHFLFQGVPYAMQTFEGRDTKIFIVQDGLFFLTYSLIGCLCFGLAIRPIERLVRKAGGRPALWAAPLFFLTALGVYLGLVIRLNSWHIVTHPSVVLHDALQTLRDGQLAVAILIFGFLLFLLYELLDIFLDGLDIRLRRHHIHLPYLHTGRHAHGPKA